MTARPYQLLPPLDEEQRHLLFQSIKKSGVLEPVVFDEDGEILDGHHRVEIAEELDIDYPRRVVTGLDEENKRRYAITTNVARRQLSSTVRGSLVAQLRSQGMSIRKIAAETGLPRETVRRDVAGDPDGSPEKVIGLDGKSHPTARPTPTPGSTDAAHSPPADPGAAPAPVADESPALPTPQEPGPTPESAAAPSTAPAGPGSGEAVAPREGGATATPPSSLARTPEQVEQMRVDAARGQAIANARKKADQLVGEVSALVTQIVSGVRYGEPGLITAELVAGLRAEADRLESFMEAHV